MKPIRVQLSRKKGWRKPPNTVVVARPSNWGNPYHVIRTRPCLGDPLMWCINHQGRGCWSLGSRIEAQTRACEEYRAWLNGDRAGDDMLLGFRSRRQWILDHLYELRDKNLACWCPIGTACHADILCEMANREASK